MKFHNGSQQGVANKYNTRFPVIDGSQTIYSPLVFSGANNLVSPFSADIVVHPSRDNRLNDVMKSEFTNSFYGGSDWPVYFYPSARDSSRTKAATDLSNFVSRRGSTLAGISPSYWASRYYNGHEYFTSTIEGTTQTAVNLGEWGGVFWNLNNFSGAGGTPQTEVYKKLVYNFGGIVSVQSKMFQENVAKYTFTWDTYTPLDHYYYNEFNISTATPIKNISISGTLQPFDYLISVGFKGGNWVSSYTPEAASDTAISGILWLGSHQYTDFGRCFNWTKSASIKNLVNGNTDTTDLQNGVGIVRHFKHASDGYDYFLMDGQVKLSSIWNQSISGISCPVFTFNVNTASNYDDNSGAVWTNASATILCTNGTTYTRYTNSTKTAFHTQPHVDWGNTISWLEDMNIKANFYVDDLKFGIKYKE